MKKKKFSNLSVFIILFVLAAIPATVYLIQRQLEIREKAAEVKMWIVCNTTGQVSNCDYNFDTNPRAIQDAVDASSDGDTVIIKEGYYGLENYYNEFHRVIYGTDYYFHSYIFLDNKDIIVSGEGKGTVIDSKIKEINTGTNRYVTVLCIDSSSKIEKVKINNSGTNVIGLYLLGNSTSDIQNSYINTDQIGIRPNESTIARISNNIIEVSITGIQISRQSKVEITNNIIRGIQNNAYIGVDLTYLESQDNLITNNVITGFKATNSDGAGILEYESANCSAIIKNNVIVNNRWGIYFYDQGLPDLDIGYNDTYNNSSGNYYGISNPGEGEMNVNPQFLDEEYHLSDISPVIDKGDPTITDPFDITGNAKPPAKGTKRSDMGAYGGPGAAGWLEELAPNKIEVCNRDDHFSDGDCEGIAFKYQWCSTAGLEECSQHAIQNAINDVADGGEVYIKRGQYIYDIINYYGKAYEFGYISGKSVKVKGESNYSTVLSDNYTKDSSAFWLHKSQDFVIENFIIKGFSLGGIWIGGSSEGENNSRGIIRNNIFIGNNDGIIASYKTEINLINNTFSKNRGIGINIISCGERNPLMSAINNIITKTIKNNEGTEGFGIGGECFHDQGKLDNDIFRYNLIWNNEGDGTDCNNQELCEDFSGRIEADPLFVSETDFHLQPESPALDSGDPEICDINGTRSDMGAYGGGGTCGVSGNSVKVKLKLERKVSDGVTHYTNEKVRVKIVNSAGTTVSDFDTATNDAGETEFAQIGQFEDGSFGIYIKPYQYISKKKTLTLQQGQNTIDFTESEFRVGDLNESISSYDFMNSLDFSSFIKFFREQDDPVKFKLADLNIDGAVNSVDYSIMIKTYRENNKGELISDPK